MLRTRVLTALVLLPLAVGALWLGGMAFAALAAAAVLLMWAEWTGLAGLPLLVRRVGLGLLAAAVLLAMLARMAEAALTLGFGALILGVFAGSVAGRAAGRQAALGLLYCGLPGVALIWLRGLPWGFFATLFVMLSVWAADIAAYFTGRAVGGPRLAPTISPGKTWSGAVGGVAGAMLAGAALAQLWPGWHNVTGTTRLVLAALPLAILSILGDLYESALKRRAGVKDSGTILPGHGGVLDRLDGLVPVAVAGAGLFALTGWAG